LSTAPLFPLLYVTFRIFAFLRLLLQALGLRLFSKLPGFLFALPLLDSFHAALLPHQARFNLSKRKCN